MMRLYLCALVSALVLGTAARAVVVDAVVAVVEGEPVLYSDVQALRASLQRQGESVGSEEELVERRIEDILIGRRARALGVDVGSKDIDDAVARVADQNRMTRDQLLAAVAAQGISADEYRRLLRDQILRMRIVQKEIEPVVRIDQADLIAYMKARPDQFSSPPTVLMRLRVFAAGALPAFCPEISACVGHNLLNGDAAEALAGTVAQPVPWRDLAPPIQAWIGGAAKPGEIRGFAGAEDSLVLVEYIESRAGELRALEEVEDEVYALVHREKLERAFRQWLLELKSTAWIERFPVRP